VARERLASLAGAGALSARVKFLIQGDTNRRHVAPQTLAQMRHDAPQDLHDLLRGDTGGGGTGRGSAPPLSPMTPVMVTKSRTIKRRNADGTVETVTVRVRANE